MINEAVSDRIRDVVAQTEISIRNQYNLQMWDYINIPEKEGYKQILYERVRGEGGILINSWKTSDVGTGKICSFIRKAVNDPSNNLVYKSQKISFLERLDNMSVDESAEFEEALFMLYHSDNDNESFDNICTVLGSRNFDLMGYLFFLKDKDKFLPVFSDSFDKRLDLLHVEHMALSRNCDWNHYIHFIDCIREIQYELRKLYPNRDVSLLDAHSFVWTIGYMNIEPSYDMPGPQEDDPELCVILEEDENTGLANRSGKGSPQDRNDSIPNDSNYPKDFVSEVNVSIDDWKTMLIDPDIFRENDIALMKEIYLSENHAISCYDLGLKHGKKPSSYLRPVVTLAMRVSRVMELPPIYGNNGKRIWWRVLFWGRYCDDNHFEWKLRPELAAALGSVYPYLSNYAINDEMDSNLLSDIKEESSWEVSESFNYEGIPKKKAEPVLVKGQTVYPRDRKVAINALVHAGSKCEIDEEHPTFIRRSSEIPYTEPHHLVPMAYSDRFDVSLDIEENIVSLCSNCHNQLHYGRDTMAILHELYEQRKELLRRVGIEISFDELLKMY